MLEENLFNGVRVSGFFINNLDFCEETDQIFLEIWLNKGTELFFELVFVSNGTDFINFSNFGLKFCSHFLV